MLRIRSWARSRMLRIMTGASALEALPKLRRSEGEEGDEILPAPRQIEHSRHTDKYPPNRQPRWRAIRGGASGHAGLSGRHEYPRRTEGGRAMPEQLWDG